MKKIVLELDLHDERTKQKAMEKVSRLVGVESLSVDMKEKKLTVIGDVDAVKLAKKLRRLCHTDVVSVGPAKEEKGGEKKSGEGKEVKDGKGENKERNEAWTQAHLQWLMMRDSHDAFMWNHPCALRCGYEDPNSCVIC